MSGAEKVKVFVEVRETVTLAKTVKMTRAEFDAIDRDLSANDCMARRQAAEKVRGMLHPVDDFQDADDPEVDEFRLEKDGE